MTSEGLRYVFVVRRSQSDVYKMLKERFAEDPDVRVVWDRRAGDRRKARRPVGRDQRRVDRRGAQPSTWETFGFLVVIETPEEMA
ncbi:MAG TPA: hypothetical protein VGW35_16450 [Methylomirabilota bacterium]|jgi:hypothetical protein|nr:hypothetical protein [Methylomirabilota bacterium]